jgi:site-specific DNA recombinase
MATRIILAGYVRNSDPSKKDSEVLKAQMEALREYADRVYNADIPDELMYKDAISALKHPYWERAGLMEAWDGAEAGKFPKILVTEFFRVARKSSEQYAVMEYFKRFNVELVSITEKFEDTAEGRLLHAVQGFLGEIEAEKTRIRTARGKKHRASMALTGQGKRTYGYKFADTPEYENGRYILNTDVVAYVDGKPWTELDVLAFERESCLQGRSVRWIALALTKMNIPTQTGNKVWNWTTVLQHLTNGNYRGYPYAVNHRYVREGRKSSVKRTNEEECIQLPEGIVPRIVEPEEFDRIQQQLRINKDMAARNNPRPNDSLLRGGLIKCGICGYRMHVGHHNKPQGQHTEPQRSDYHCRRNEGTDDLIRHHSVTIDLDMMDEAAWNFAIPYIKDSNLIRSHAEKMKKQLERRVSTEDLEKQLADIRDRIVNLLSVAEAAHDEDTRKLYRERLAVLEKDKRDTEGLIAKLNNATKQDEELRAAIERIEKRCAEIRPLLDDPSCCIPQEEKRAMLLLLGVRATVWPDPGYLSRVRSSIHDRIQLEIAPPDLNKYCDFDIVKAIQYAGEKMRAAEQAPVAAGEGGGE